MGIFDQQGFLFTTGESRRADIKGFFSDVTGGARDAVQGTVGIVKDITHEVFDDTGKIVSSVTGDIKDTVLGAAHEAGGAITGVTANLSMPLLIGALVIGGAFLLKK